MSGDFGSDRVFRRGEQLVIETGAEMPEWHIMEKRKTAILIGDGVWCLSGKEFDGNQSTRYILDPWPEHMNQIPGHRIRYDAAYVKARNEASKTRKQRDRISAVLDPFRLLIGFLPSGLSSPSWKTDTEYLPAAPHSPRSCSSCSDFLLSEPSR
jgi:hypothetical protein